jgi:hypothetical protein
MVAIDPKTGEIVSPTAEQRQAMQLGVTQNRSPAALSSMPDQVSIPGGGTLVMLKGRGTMYVMAHVDASGKVVTDCGADPNAPTSASAPAPRGVEK